jgi:hypothetical protein
MTNRLAALLVLGTNLGQLCEREQQGENSALRGLFKWMRIKMWRGLAASA